MFAACVTSLVLTACGHAAPAAHATALKPVSLRVKGMMRTFLLDAPATNQRLPLVLVYHGDEATAAQTENADWHGDARHEDEIVAFLQGVEDSWNAGVGVTAARRAGADDVAFTQAAIHRIEATHRVNTSRVAATGFSDGAFLTDLLGCRLAGEIDLIAPMEGELGSSISPTCHPLRPVTVFEVHATGDPVVPYAGGHIDGSPAAPTVLSADAAVARWAALDHCAGPPVSRSRAGSTLKTWFRCAQGARVTLDTTTADTHDWPPGPGELVASALRRLR